MSTDKKPTIADVVTVKREGKHLILPENLSFDRAIDVLVRVDGRHHEAARHQVDPVVDHAEAQTLRDGRQVMGHVGVNQKKWLPSNFRMDIVGVDCSHVSRIDSFTVKQTIRPLYTGMTRFPELEPTGVEFSNLTLYLSEEYGDEYAVIIPRYFEQIADTREKGK